MVAEAKKSEPKPAKPLRINCVTPGCGEFAQAYGDGHNMPIVLVELLNVAGWKNRPGGPVCPTCVSGESNERVENPSPKAGASAADIYCNSDPIGFAFFEATQHLAHTLDGIRWLVGTTKDGGNLAGKPDRFALLRELSERLESDQVAFDKAYEAWSNRADKRRERHMRDAEQQCPLALDQHFGS